MSATPEPTLHPQRRAFAVLSVLLLLALAAAWARDHFTEWRALQGRYNELARAAGKPTLSVGLRQLWKPALDVVDRCTSCHLAMGGAAPLAGDPLFAAHPPIPHEPRELGCTPCHGGQGRATTRQAAHGPTVDGAQPLLDRANVEAGCGTCHTGLKTPAAALVERGEQLMKDYECQGCHPPESLASVGMRGLTDAWHDQHLGLTPDGGLTFAPLADEDVPLVTAALSTRVGAPRLQAGKQLVAARGCRGCHALNGVGVEGEEGPNLNELPPRVELSTAALANFHREHLLDPQRWARDSKMPRLGLTTAQAELITVYLLSLRARTLPEAKLPIDRVRTSRLGERDFPGDGASLYAAFCSGCHGLGGEGRQFESRQRAPALKNPVFLALADDEFLRRSISQGRAGRRMPAWNKPGRLSPRELEAVVGFLRSLEPPAPAFDPGAPPPEPAEGAPLFAEQCAPCHGARGEGSPLAPPLAAQDNEVTRSDDRIHGTLAMGVAGTAMGSFRTLDPRQLRAVIATVRQLPRLELSRAQWKAQPGDPQRGATLFQEHCVSCHEPAEGRQVSEGPNLRNPALLAVAGDGYLAGTIIRGRPGDVMPAFGVAGQKHQKLEAAQVADVVAFLRAAQPPASSRPAASAAPSR